MQVGANTEKCLPEGNVVLAQLSHLDKLLDFTYMKPPHFKNFYKPKVDFVLLDCTIPQNFVIHHTNGV